MFPYLLMAGLYLALAALVALDASLVSFSVLRWFHGLPWLRVHFITLGVLAQAVFGLMPVLAAARAGRASPAARWDIWLTLNAGLLTLVVGIPLINAAAIIAGGTLVFAAAVLLMHQLHSLRPAGQPAAGQRPGRAFYLAGLSFLLLGIFLGAGLWLGWGQALAVANAKEVHIHANLWGFTSLVFAGLIVDLYPGFAGRLLAWPRSITAIFCLLTVGAVGLVVGPWLAQPAPTVVGLVLLWAGTLWLLANVIVPLAGREHWRAPGLWHLVTAYAWVITPLMLGPLVLLGAVQVPGAAAEQNAPQALVYGWVLQFSYAVAPYIARRALLPGQPTRLGGNWFSLLAVHAGVLFLVLSIFNAEQYAALHGTAYAFWAASLVPAGLEVWRVLRAGLARVEGDGALAAADDSAPPR